MRPLEPLSKDVAQYEYFLFVDEVHGKWRSDLQCIHFKCILATDTEQRFAAVIAVVNRL